MAQVEHGPDDEPRLYPHYVQFLSTMEAAANGTAAWLQDSWRQPDHSGYRPFERIALRNTVVLDEVCEKALETGTHQSWAVKEAFEEAEPETRYEVHAAMRMIPRLVLPFKRDLDKLKVPFDKRLSEGALWEVNQAGGIEATMAMARKAMGNRKIVADWHRWLWLGDASDHEPGADHGDASMLAIAASRLCTKLQTVLGESQPSSG